MGLKRTLKARAEKPINTNVELKEPAYEGSDMVVSTGSTLLDLAISGGRFEQGGIPSGIMVEIFGPAGAGKTVLLCEIAGNIQRKRGQVMFKDPEARLNKQFASLFGFNPDEVDYDIPHTVPEVFAPIRKWEPENTKVINGVFADSLAALSTDMEQEGTDKYGMRRAKEFSEELRKTCRVITDKNILLVCSNQVRVNVNAGMFEEKYRAPGGESIAFYASLRLRAHSPKKIKVKKKVRGKEITKVVGVQTTIDVYKSSVWQPYHTADIVIKFDYGIDDIYANLQYVKQMTGSTQYCIPSQDLQLGKRINDAILYIENNDLEDVLKKEVITIWREVNNAFTIERKPKRRK